VAEPETAPPASGGLPSRRVRRSVIAAIIALTIAGWTGDLLLGVLLDRHPLIFIALNSRNRNLVLASEYLDPWSFYGVALLRLLASDPLFFLLGRWYGDAGVRWMERKAPTYGRMMRTAERWFNKAAYPLVALAPNNFICLFAGAGGMGVAGFFVANVTGTIVRLVVLRTVGDVLSSPLGAVRHFIQDHRLLVVAISAVLLSISIWSEKRSGGTEVETLAHLDEELTGADTEADAAPEPAGGDEP